MMKPLLTACGLVFLGFGAVGIFIPLLPTTPFLLASAFCFARSNERLNNYLITHPTFGEYIRNYNEGSMAKRHKMRTLVLLWISIIFSAWLIGKTITWIMLPAIATGVSIQILLLKPKAA